MTDTGLVSRYDDAASWWQGMVHRLGYRAAYEELIPRALSGVRPDRVADVGTGTGDLAAAFCIAKGSPAEITLIDTSAGMLAAAEETVAPFVATLTTRHAALDEIADNAQFDLVLCAHLIEHTADPVLSLRGLGRLLAPKGVLLLLVSRPHWCQWLIWLRWRHRWFSPGRVREMAAAAGLECDAPLRLKSGPPSRTSFAYVLRAVA